MARRGNYRCFLLFLLLAIAAGGCDAPGTPHDRLGALPFPGPLTLNATADPKNLGPHRYERSLLPFPPISTERGIVYTADAGFVDLAHCNETIDWTRYYAEKVRALLERGASSGELAGPNYSRFHFTFNYPPGWDVLTP